MATKISWFGSHMRKALSQVEERLRVVDMILEVRDARIPFTSANPQLESLVQHKRRLVVLNKADLAAPEKQQAVQHQLQLQKQYALFTSNHKRGSVHKLLNTVMKKLQQDKPKADMLVIMAVGVPNCGKSSLINGLRQAAMLGKHSGKRAETGRTPGLTRQIAGFQVGERPTAFLMDTPGVMPPNVPDEQAGLRLALTGAIKDSFVGEERLVRHLLLELSQQPSFPEACLEAGQNLRFAGQKSFNRALQQAVMAAVAAIRQSLKDSSTEPKDALQATKKTTDLEAGVASDDCLEEISGKPALDIDAGLAALHCALKGDTQTQEMVNAMHGRLIAAYRAGRLGRYTLDSLP